MGHGNIYSRESNQITLNWFMYGVVSVPFALVPYASTLLEGYQFLIPIFILG